MENFHINKDYFYHLIKLLIVVFLHFKLKDVTKNKYSKSEI